MLLRLGWKDFLRNLFLNVLIILLLMVVFLAALTAVSAVEIRMKDYDKLKPFMDKKGVYLEVELLTHGANRLVYKDAQEIKDALSGAEDVLTVAEVWESYVKGKKVNTWCYSTEVVDMMSPDMETGRWFMAEDNQSKTLKAVVSHNADGIKTGDIITIKSGLMDCSQEAEVIGVMEDNVKLYSTALYGEPYKDYRDCFYTYNYETEGGTPLLILSDRQILGNQAKRWFPYLNYRLNGEIGFMKQIKGGILITYPDTVSDETIEEDMMMLGIGGMIYHRISLSKMRENSRKYIFEELYNLFPIILCVMVFILIAAVSAGAISVKKGLKNYAIYYICGLRWSQCARISLVNSMIAAMTAFLFVHFSVAGMQVLGKLEENAIRLGFWQVLVCAVLMVFFVLVSWLLPMSIVRHTSANRVLRENS